MKVQINAFPKRYSQDRKFKINIEKFDSWDAGHTLSLIIYPLLLQLRDTMPGLPADFAHVGGEDYVDQGCFDFYAEDSRECFKIRCDEWTTTLDKMIWSFQQIADADWEDIYHHGDLKFHFEPTHNSANKLVYDEDNTHWTDHVGRSLHADRIQEGLDLFAKYYMNLWD